MLRQPSPQTDRVTSVEVVVPATKNVDVMTPSHFFDARSCHAPLLMLNQRLNFMFDFLKIRLSERLESLGQSDNKDENGH